MRPTLRRRRIAPALLLLAAAFAPAAAAPPRDERPNIVFILADDLGWTDLACQGSRYYETPHIDRLAATGMRFTDAYTCGPNCQPTRAALMSGQYGPRTGVYTVGSIERFDWRRRPLRPVDNVEKLPLDKITLPQALKAGGYATGMFGKWHLGERDEYHPSRRGFDEAVTSMGRHFHFATQPPVEHPKEAYLADWLTDRAEDFIRRHRDRPFFLYLAHFAVHAPLEAKPDLVERFKPKPAAGGHQNPVYAAMIASLDESVGRILRLLDELTLSEKTLVLFSSDNGGVGGYVREGIKQAGDITDNAPLRSGKGSLHEGGIRVPFIARWPGRIAPGAVSDRPINSVDLYPTLLELAGVPAPAGYVLDGTSFAGLLLGREVPPRGPLFWHFPGYLGAGQDTWRTTPVGVVRHGDWKLMEFFEDGRLELYNLREDLGEKRNLAAEHPDRARELKDRLEAWRKEIGAPLPRPKTEADLRGPAPAPGRKRANKP